VVITDMARKRQDSPSIRGFKQRGFRLNKAELEHFDADASKHGGTSKYLRYLWEQDRLKRGLMKSE
jgi:hypothetical protein